MKSLERTLSLLGGALILLTQSNLHADLEPLKYNNPGLKVDLGVGLWAWPMPMDYDGDGDMDLLVACPDKPTNGVYYFENPSQDPKVLMPTFKPGPESSHAYIQTRCSPWKNIAQFPGQLCERESADPETWIRNQPGCQKR